MPNLTNASNFGGRIDYNASQSDRFFFRYAGTTFHEQLGDWTYESPNPKYHGLHVNDKTRASWAYTGNWTKVPGIDRRSTRSFSTNRFFEDQQRRGMHQYKPTDVGLPSYLDEFCGAVEQCMMPVISVERVPGRVERPPTAALDATHVQAQSNITSVKGDHTLRGGIDYRLAMRRGELDRRRQRVVDVHVRQHVHARGGYDHGVPGQQHRPESRGADARHSDAGVDRPEHAGLDAEPVLRQGSSRTRGAPRRTSR